VANAPGNSLSHTPTEEIPRRGVTVLPTAPMAVGEAVFFSFDDFSIPFTHNLRLTMHRPLKYPENPVVSRGRAGTPDEFGVQFYGSVVRHEGRFKMWYVAADREIGRDARCIKCWRPAYAESKDGIHWEKPNLGLVEHSGSRENNLVLMEPAPLGMINLKVLIEPDDPDPARRYKMVALTWWWEHGKRGRGTLCPLFSTDGLRWCLGIDVTPVNGCLPVENILLPRHHFEAAGGLYKWHGLYHAAGQSHAPPPLGSREYSGREVVIHRSPDFVDWSETTSIGFLREGQHRSFAYSEGEETHEGVSVWHRGNVLLGLYGLWHGAPDWKDRTIDLGFVISNDGLRFREPVTEWAFLVRGDDGSWDQGGLIQGQGFENVGDRTYVWYGAWDLRVGMHYTPRGGVGLAILERDRFGSLSVRDHADGATFITSPLKVEDSLRLWINGDGFSHDARLRVELLDEREQPLTDFSGDRAGMVQQDSLRSTVLWEGGDQIRGLQGPFRVKIIFEGNKRQAIRFYALYISG